MAKRPHPVVTIPTDDDDDAEKANKGKKRRLDVDYLTRLHLLHGPPPPACASYVDRYIPSRTASQLDSKAILPPLPPFSTTRDFAVRRVLMPRKKERILQFANCAPASSTSSSSSTPSQFLHNRTLGVLPSSPIRRWVKTLDAPDMVQNFYYNLLAWSADNVVAVGLKNVVYLYRPSGKVWMLRTFEPYVQVTNVTWLNAQVLAVATNSCGEIHLIPVEASVLPLTACLPVHQDYVQIIASVSNNPSLFISGSQDTTIKYCDTRLPTPNIWTSNCHEDHVCGLALSNDGGCLASGGNDNKVFVMDLRKRQPVLLFEHKSGVKALAWSPTQSNVLATGGGRTDTTLRIWDMNTSKEISSSRTGAQISNVAWSKDGKELVTTHGFSAPILGVWSFPTLDFVIRFEGHTSNVLYLAAAPDGEHVMSGAGGPDDETCRIWKVFHSRIRKPRKGSPKPVSLLTPICR